MITIDMRILISSLFFFLSSAFLISCSTKEAENIDIKRLHDIWALESIEGRKIIIDETIKNLPVLEIYVEVERVHGNTSCNALNGNIKIDGNRISFFEIITTEMACPGDLERKFLSALKKVDNYKIEKLRLFLFQESEVLLTLRKID
jgi:heat shock protein HslJ